MTQFADNTTILLDGYQNSLTGSLNTLEVFGTISGLKMNTDKTKVIWIGKKKFLIDKLISKYNLILGEDEFQLLGLFNVNLDKTISKNYEKALVKIKGSIKSWNKRYLTPLTPRFHQNRRPPAGASDLALRTLQTERATATPTGCLVFCLCHVCAEQKSRHIIFFL